MDGNLTIENGDTAFLLITFLGCLLVIIVVSALYVAFGPPSKKLRDPFEEHED